MAPLTLVANLATRWRHLHWLRIWPPDGTTCIDSKVGHQVASLTLVNTRWPHLHSCKFDHQMALLALVAKLATRWRHLLELKNWPPDGATCISCKFSHQLESLGLPHCVGMPYWHYQLVLSWYLHQPESHQLSLQKVSQFLN